MRPYQLGAAEALCPGPKPVRRGVVKSPAGSGKTWMAAYALWRYAESRPMPTDAVWVAHTREQCDQARAALDLFPHDSLTVRIFCYAGCPWVGDADVIVFDEAQHVPADTFRKIVDDYEGIRWGFSATPEREDDKKTDVFDLIGPIVYEVPRDELIRAGSLCQGEVKFVTFNAFDEFIDPVKERADQLFVERAKRFPFLFRTPVGVREQMRRILWQSVLEKAVDENPKRDECIVGLAGRHPDKSTLIIVHKIEYGERLAPLLPGAEMVHAKLGKKARREIIDRFRNGETKILIATSLADEGLDVPVASVLILAAPSKNKGKAEQRTGRVMRTFSDKADGLVYDLYEIQHPLLRNQAMQRVKRYEDLGYKISTEDYFSEKLNETSTPLSKTPMPPEDNATCPPDMPTPAQPTGETPIEVVSALADAATDPAQNEPTTPKLEHEDREHSKHSPSSLEPILRCAGFLNDKSRPTTAADRGSLGHLAVEKEDPELCGDDDSLKKATEMCLKYLNRLRANASAKGNFQEFKELRIPVQDQSGSFDHLILECGIIEADLVDYKFAYNYHTADGMQAKAYVAGIFDKWPSLQKIRVHMVHPFLNQVSVETYARGDEDMINAEVRAVIERARRADPADFRVNKYCAYCARAGSCPVLGKIAHGLAERYVGEKLDLPDDPFESHGSNFTDPVATSKLLKLAPLIENVASSIRRGAMKLRIEDGIDIPGFRLVESSAPRKIANAALAFDAVKTEITPEEFIAASDMKIGALEDLYASKAPKGKKGAYKAKLGDILMDASALTSGAPVHKLLPEKEEAPKD